MQEPISGGHVRCPWFFRGHDKEIVPPSSAPVTWVTQTTLRPSNGGTAPKDCLDAHTCVASPQFYTMVCSCVLTIGKGVSDMTFVSRLTANLLCSTCT